YFATNCFDSFIYDTPATGLLACAEILNFTGRYEVKSIELKDVTVKETDTAGNKKFTVSIIVNEVDEHSFETKFTYDDNGLIEFVYIPAVNEFEAILGVK
ncbi:MAG: hypothetical protein IIY11_01800, partial [Clostridia bacterium]|nr:hypothetical protein [Clostridia bacterium]